eukprot:TRINITY_DN13004_c0_g1_i1.p1 TRINITY_DN13004_c0_g1~~TRINITY_DN13004_c0_g1_i1.p1  ORF type:complete len:247 (-),score=37.51 TRINITY_DN13004_c0_g1_i1:48-767(-)
MALVPFSYASPFHDSMRLPERLYIFGAHHIRMIQDWGEDGRGGTALGFGAAVQDAAFVLSYYLYEHCPHLLQGKHVVELGTGPGLVSIIAALLGARRVVATDGDAELLQSLTQRNMELNAKQHVDAGVLSTAQLLWGVPEQYDRAQQLPVDVLLGADIVACPYVHDFENLVQTFDALSGPETVILLSYRRRSGKEDWCFEMLKERFVVEEAPVQMLHKDFWERNISVFRLRKRATATSC